MTEGKKDDKEDDVLDVLWAVPGLVATLALISKWAEYAEISPEDKLTGGQFVILLILLVGPALVLVSVGEKLRKEVHRSRMSWESYWTAFFGISGPIFVFMGVTGVDEFFKLFDSFT